MTGILHAVATWIMGCISASGYWGIVLLMGIESACIPLPSEIIMPFGGYLVYAEPERFNIWWMGVAGAAGCVWGSIVAYYLGLYGGRPLAEKYGRYFLVRRKDLDRADKLFAKYGDAVVFFGRLLPVVRTFISFPAGVSKMHLGRFIVYTFLGSFPWCLGLAWAGQYLGEKWDTELKKYFHNADVVIVAVILVLIALYIYFHLKGEREAAQPGARS